MGDHVVKARRDPPDWRDHANWNAMQVAVALASSSAAVAMAVDIVVPKEVWIASWSLDLTAELSQLSTAALLFFGGILTAAGVVLRPSRWKPITSIMVEALGWLCLALGWASFTVAVLAHARSGATITVLLSGGVALGAVWECWLLFSIGLDSLKRVNMIRRTAANMKQLEEGFRD